MAPWSNDPFDGVSAGLRGADNIEPFLTRGFQGSTPQVLKGNVVPRNYLPFVNLWLSNLNPGGGEAGTFDIISLVYDKGDGVPRSRTVYTIVTADDTQIDSSVNYIIAPLAGDPGSLLLFRATVTGASSDTDDELNYSGFYARNTLNQ